MPKNIATFADGNKNTENMQNRIKENIVKSGRQQKEIAEALGITTVGLSQLSNGSMPKFETFSKIAAVLGVPAWKLFLSDHEINEIRQQAETLGSDFRCPCCGAPLTVVACED